MTPQRPTGVSPFAILISRTKHSFADKAPRVLRVIALLAVIYGTIFVAFGYRARADVREVMLGMGAQMMRYAGTDRQDEPRAIYLNGQQMMLATATTSHPLKDVLDFFEARCHEHDGNFSAEISRMPEYARAAWTKPARGLLDSTVRIDGDHRGVVACLDTGKSHLTIEELGARMADFSRTGDLGSVGLLRYAFVERERGETHIVTFWTDDHFVVREMFPAAGDAPGRDLSDVPRAPDSRRLLSAWEANQPQSMTVYALSSKSRDDLKGFYATALPKTGWHVTDPESAQNRGHSAPPQHTKVLTADKGNRTLFLVFGEDSAHHGNATLLVSQ